ncbi:hypothetical protein BSPLISOX_212 [uncultured Gammaproteobacteria bacterium]|nr:hypothetical protein [uncultured Gammaproteobacteria bacterium]VVH65450.1 hypothetical protein BSPLISOX_212 [uncultured Gammaproteobacteria bacterium]
MDTISAHSLADSAIRKKLAHTLTNAYLKHLRTTNHPY